jgi:spore coat polysaccharide biosynthesis protein SpsF (cytidylyltransferase family)
VIFFRVCGDTPLYDPKLLLKGARILEESSFEYGIVTSCPNRGYPQGQNIELISTQLFIERYGV